MYRRGVSILLIKADTLARQKNIPIPMTSFVRARKFVYAETTRRIVFLEHEVLTYCFWKSARR